MKKAPDRGLIVEVRMGMVGDEGIEPPTFSV
jgi:hypothetical protein